MTKKKPHYALKMLWTLSKVFIAGLILFYLEKNSLLNIATFKKFSSSPCTFIFVISCFLAMAFFSSLRWQLINKAQNINIGLIKMSLITYAGLGFNSILPGNVGGDFIRLHFLLKNTSCQKTSCVLSISCDRLIGLIGIFTFLLPFVLFNYKALLQAHLLALIIKLSLIFTLIVVFLLIALAFGHVFATHFLKKTEHHILRKIHNYFKNISYAFHLLKKKKLSIITAVLISTVIQGLMVITLLAINNGLSFPSISNISFITANSVTQIANLIPITPGGIGVGETAFAKIILSLNSNIIAPYATVLLMYRIIGIFSYLPGFFYFIFLNKELHKSLP